MRDRSRSYHDLGVLADANETSCGFLIGPLAAIWPVHSRVVLAERLPEVLCDRVQAG